ncbi:MAG: hypothetical protein NUV45_05620 [Tepidanaerobacteraceae bacterium]|jgi:hypothetical protein|nr:hypothetical protein [Tepidanaerobacteraceae bacterium]
MKGNFVSDQFRQVERSIRICLKQNDACKNQNTKPEVLSGLMTLSYSGILLKALMKGDAGNFKAGEKEIDEMVDYYMKEFND